MRSVTASWFTYETLTAFCAAAHVTRCHTVYACGYHAALRYAMQTSLFHATCCVRWEKDTGLLRPNRHEMILEFLVLHACALGGHVYMGSSVLTREPCRLARAHKNDVVMMKQLRCCPFFLAPCCTFPVVSMISLGDGCERLTLRSSDDRCRQTPVRFRICTSSPPAVPISCVARYR